MKLTPVFSTAIIGIGKRKALKELGLDDIEGKGNDCMGRIEYAGEEGTPEERAKFDKLAEKLTRKGGPLGVEIVVHVITRYLTRTEIKELAQQMADRLDAA